MQNWKCLQAKYFELHCQLPYWKKFIIIASLLPASSFLFCWSSALCISRSVHCDLKCRGCQAWYRLNWYVAPEEKCLSMTAADRVWNLKRSKMTIFPSNEQLSQATTTTTATLATIIIVRSVQKIQNTKLTTHSLTNSQLPSSPIKYFHSSAIRPFYIWVSAAISIFF